MCKAVLPLFLLFFGLPPVVVGQERAAGAPLAGCYRIELSQWEPPLRHPDNAPYHTPPMEFRLHATTGDGMFERDLMIARPLIPHGRTPTAYWYRPRPDSLRVVWTDGVTGVQLDLATSSDALRGTATALTDIVGPPVSKAEVVVRRTPCASVQK
jgi:hypothetical protein